LEVEKYSIGSAWCALGRWRVKWVLTVRILKQEGLSGQSSTEWNLVTKKDFSIEKWQGDGEKKSASR